MSGSRRRSRVGFARRLTMRVLSRPRRERPVRDLHRLKTFAGEDVFHVVVESPRGAVVKLKYSPDLGAMSISRPLVLGITYACDWGYVPSTKGPDGDPVDAAIWWDVATYPGVVIPCRALALVRVEPNAADGSGRIRNDRIVAVPEEARREAHLELTTV